MMYVWNVDRKWFSNAHPEIQNLFHNKNLIDFQFPHPSVSKEDDIKCKKIYWKHSEIYNYDILYGSCSDRPHLRLRK